MNFPSYPIVNICSLMCYNGSGNFSFFQPFFFSGNILQWVSGGFLAIHVHIIDRPNGESKKVPLSWLRTSFMNCPLVLCIVCNCQGRKNQPPLSLLFCHKYSYYAVYKLTSGNCTVVKINNNPTCRLTRPFCLLVFWYYCIKLE